MGKTLIEKIIGAHSGKEVRPDDVIWINIDVRTARDFGGPNVVENLEREFQADEQLIDDITKTFFTFDTNAPANNIPYAINQQRCRDFARKHNIKVFDVDNGIGTHTLMELGYILPGTTAVGTDSHFNILGALGAFGQGMGDRDVAFAFKTGRVWFEVPGSVKITLKGTPPANITPKDVVLRLLKEFGAHSLLGKSAELYGDYIEHLSIDGRITISSMATEMGLISLFPKVTSRVVAWLKERTDLDIQLIEADGDAEYEAEYTIDISNLTPLIAVPYEPQNVEEVSAVAGQEVNSVFVGSCTNGRLEDMRIVAEVLTGKQIAEGVMLRIVPATRRIYQSMLEEGLVDVLFASGAIISHAACAGCASGQIGMTGRGEVQVSTGNRNFKGKQGPGATYLASPRTAALTALNGYISG